MPIAVPDNGMGNRLKEKLSPKLYALLPATPEFFTIMAVGRKTNRMKRAGKNLVYMPNTPDATAGNTHEELRVVSV